MCKLTPVNQLGKVVLAVFKEPTNPMCNIYVLISWVHELSTTYIVANYL